MSTGLDPARPRLVVSLGDNAFGTGGTGSVNGDAHARVQAAAAALAPLLETWDLVVTHGNGPLAGGPVADSGGPGRRATRLDVVGAGFEGVLGYQLEAALDAAIPQSDIAVLLTQMVVDDDDPAFGRPDRAIGPGMTEDEARRLAVERGWFVGPGPDGWHRLVASPEPVRVLEQRALEVLVAAGVTVVCAGGGGIPVVIDDDGVRGVNALIDKDLAAAVVAGTVHAQALTLLTDVDALYESYGTPDARPIRSLGAEQARQGVWARGTIGPKVEACARFVQQHGGWAAIGALAQAEAVVAGRAGTRVVAGSAPVVYWERGET